MGVKDRRRYVSPAIAWRQANLSIRVKCIFSIHKILYIRRCKVIIYKPILTALQSFGASGCAYCRGYTEPSITHE
jgi:hypothetical protein